MRLLFFLMALLFVALPYDLQIWLLSLIRPLWLSQSGQALMFGALGASAAAMGWYSWGWNSLADTLYHEDLRKAEQSLQQRRRGR
jgi:hypothetical protein